MTQHVPDPGIADDPDRREFFRIDDNVVLTYRRIPQDDLPDTLRHLGEHLDEGFTLAATFAGMSQSSRALHQQVRMESAAVAQYVDLLEQKLDMLARVLMLREMGIDERDTRRVNLSANGMEFHADEDLPENALLEIKFVVFPSRTGILAGGQVVRCERDPEADPAHPYKVAVRFAHLREADRQLLVRHVLGKQSDELRRAHDDDESGDKGYMKAF